jgi:hypothetical protein
MLKAHKSISTYAAASLFNTKLLLLIAQALPYKGDLKIMSPM